MGFRGGGHAAGRLPRRKQDDAAGLRRGWQCSRKCRPGVHGVDRGIEQGAQQPTVGIWVHGVLFILQTAERAYATAPP
jgi:hypothetical protein